MMKIKREMATISVKILYNEHLRWALVIISNCFSQLVVTWYSPKGAFGPKNTEHKSGATQYVALIALGTPYSNSK